MATAVGFLGTGFIARFHVMMLSLADADSEIVAVHDTDAERAAAFAEDHGGEVLDTPEAVIERADVVYVCTWTSEHAALVDRVAGAGKAVFCEKPLAFNATDAAAMAERVEAAGVVNQVGLVLRYSPAFLLLQALVADERAGKVMSVVFRDDQYIPNQGQYESVWRMDRARAGSGALLEHSIHDLDIIEHAIGPIRSVAAQTANVHGHDGIEDNVAVLFRLEGGALGVLTSVWHDILERPSGRYVEVVCERAHIVLEGDIFGPVRWRFTGHDEREVQDDTLMAELAERAIVPGNPADTFIKAANGAATASPDFRAAVRAHELVDAVYRSAGDGGVPVALP